MSKEFVLKHPMTMHEHLVLIKDHCHEVMDTMRFALDNLKDNDIGELESNFDYVENDVDEIRSHLDEARRLITVENVIEEI